MAHHGYLFEPLREEGEDVEGHNESESSDEEVRGRTGNLDWCTCGKCGLMPSERESTCCHERGVFGKKMNSERCLADCVDFAKVCLDSVILEVIMASLREAVGENLRDPISHRFVCVPHETWCTTVSRQSPSGCTFLPRSSFDTDQLISITHVHNQLRLCYFDNLKMVQGRQFWKILTWLVVVNARG